MTDDFGDIEPEDSWDPDDPLPDLVRNLIRRVALLVVVDHLDDRARLRIIDLHFDMEHLAQRLGDG